MVKTRGRFRRATRGRLDRCPAGNGDIYLQRMAISKLRDTLSSQGVRLPEVLTRACAMGNSVSQLLRRAGLRPTRQRIALATLLFANGDRHVTAELLHEEAVRAGERVSLATVYNTLHQFKAAGLLREIAIGGQRAYFDTNTSNHNHFFVEEQGRLVDIPGDSIRVDGLPEPPPELKISHIDVVVR